MNKNDNMTLMTRTKTPHSTQIVGTKLQSLSDGALQGLRLDHYGTIAKGTGSSWLVTVFDEEGNEDNHFAYGSFGEARDFLINARCLGAEEIRWVETREHDGWKLVTARFLRVVEAPRKMRDVSFRILREISVSVPTDEGGYVSMEEARRLAMQEVADNGFTLMWIRTSAQYEH